MFSLQEIENLAKLASSVNAADTEIAYAIIQSSTIEDSMKTVLFLIAGFSKEPQTRAGAWNLLKENWEILGLRTCIKTLQRISEDRNPRENIFVLKRFIGYNDFDSELIARTVYNRFNIGLEFLLESMESETDQLNLIRPFIQGDVCQLSNKSLSQIPEILYHFDHLRVIDLSSNDLEEITKEICRFKYLEKLDVHGNNIIRIDEEIKELKELKEIILSWSSNWQYRAQFNVVKDRLSQLLPSCKIL